MPNNEIISLSDRQIADNYELESESRDIDLVELSLRLLEKWKLIFAAAILGAIIAAVITIGLIKPSYTATAKLYVLSANNAIVNLSDFQIGNYLASDYQEVFSNRRVHEQVIERLGLPYTVEQISHFVSVRNPSNTRILHITVTTKKPEEARDIANTYAQVAQEFIPQTMEGKAPTLFEEAITPSKPSAPNKTTNIILGFLVGAIIVCGLIIVRFILDDRIRTEEDIEKHVGLPTLGMMPLANAAAPRGRLRGNKSGKKAGKRRNTRV